MTPEDFARLSPAPEGSGVRTAGRLRRAEAAGKGWRVLAGWLPFPTGPHDGPGGASPGDRYHFSAWFPGAIDERGLQWGNEFVLSGRVTGREELMTLHGLRRHVPLLQAECLHVWKTGGTDLRDFQGMTLVDFR